MNIDKAIPNIIGIFYGIVYGSINSLGSLVGLRVTVIFLPITTVVNHDHVSEMDMNCIR